MPEEITLSRKRRLMYAIGFVFNLSYAIPTYVSSTFLASFAGDKLVGIVYTASSILAIAAFIEMPGLLRKIGNFRATMGLLFISILSLAGLAVSKGALAVIAAFILNFVSIALLNYSFDIFLENFSTNSKTGRIRGSFLTFANLAWLVSPLLASRILGDGLYQNLYAAAGLLLIPVMGLVFFGLGPIKEPDYKRTPFWKSLGEIWLDRDIKGILLIQFLLQFFYAWMVIYMPIYLHETIGFGWPAIGIIFTVMLLPFVLIELPLGYLADKKLGEKELLTAGFGIMAVTTALTAFVTGQNMWVWAAILFMTRVGAATVEVMADTYFFKKIDASKTHIISFSRMSRPLAYIISPVIATILFLAFDMKGLFIFLGFLMLYGLRYTLALKDTA
ncbi:MAG: MFS transporter [Candidatus Taylorbacteria bacterium]|nr:MFS transporter [Candidatus Taylorbacteria bacterium]